MSPFELRLKGLPIRRPSAGYWDRVLAQRPAATARSRSLRRRQVWLLFPVAAALLVVLGLSAVMYWYSGGGVAGKERASSGVTGPSEGPASGPRAAGRPAPAEAGTPDTLVQQTDLDLPMFSEGLAAVAHYRFGYIDHTAGWVIPPKFSLAVRFEHGIARVYDTQRGPFYYIDHRGERVAAETADRIIKARARPALRPAEGKTGRSGSHAGETKYGFVDRDGKFLIQPQYDHASDFSEGLARVCVDSRWGFIDHAGAFVIPPQYPSAGDFHEGLAVAQPTKEQAQAAGVGPPDMFGNPRCGYIDRTGKFVIPPQFPRAGRFSEGLAYVKAENIEGFIDRTGTLVIDIAKLRSETVVDIEKLRNEIREESPKGS